MLRSAAVAFAALARSALLLEPPVFRNIRLPASDAGKMAPGLVAGRRRRRTRRRAPACLMRAASDSSGPAPRMASILGRGLAACCRTCKVDCTEYKSHPTAPARFTFLFTALISVVHRDRIRRWPKHARRCRHSEIRMREDTDSEDVHPDQIRRDPDQTRALVAA
jgi:hypothetical protein